MRTLDEQEGVMTIDEAIAHCLHNVEKEKETCNIDCAKEHEQLAEWLKELKCLKEKELKVEKTELMKRYEEETGKDPLVKYWPDGWETKGEKEWQHRKKLING